MHVVWIALGGAAGTVVRYAAGAWVSSWIGGQFPWGTLLVNLSGSFVIGLLFSVAVERDLMALDIRGPLMIGFVGAYTTFSTWALESWRLAEEGAWLYAAVNVGGSAVLGVAAVIAGIAIGRMV